ncbi:hypothetical protein K8R20_00260 [bacterium]|nr:hypothetical protein [bacterium]
MNTSIIIILVVLIVIVGISIVLAIIKGNKENDTKESTSTKTFQEETPQEPQVFTPQIQQEEVSAMQDLSTSAPTVTPTLDQNPAPSPKDSVTQGKNLYNQETPLPNSSQRSKDMEELTSSPTVAAPELGSTQANTPPSSEKVSDDMQSIMDALNSSVPIPPPIVDTNQPVETPTPTVNANSVVDITQPVADQVSIMPDINTQKPTESVVDTFQPVVEQTPVDTPIPEATTPAVVDITPPSAEPVPLMPDINTRKPTAPVVNTFQPVVEQTPVDTSMPESVQPAVVDISQPVVGSVPIMPDIAQPVVEQTPAMPSVDTPMPEAVAPPVVDIKQHSPVGNPAMPDINNPPQPTTPIGV